MARYIFVTGGVVSSLGKGLSSASLAYLLQSRGFKVRIRKLDPYLNVDPGTMSPFQHGEVYVTDDGAETDLDLGHYERFSGVSAKKWRQSSGTAFAEKFHWKNKNTKIYNSKFSLPNRTIYKQSTLQYHNLW